MNLLNRHRTAAAFIILVLLPLAVFWPVVNSEFINYDDPQYVTGNWVVQQGLTFAGLKWSFGLHGANFHPVTWWSHMFDCEFNGVSATSHHVTNLLFHVANVVLLFFLLRRLTGAFWRSCLVAALFALHPMHVESVAWVAERKDLLSTFFGLLALICYSRYVQPAAAAGTDKPSSRGFSRSDYLLSLVFFSLSLMAKPMLVTLPFVMLLMDYWPLQRWTAERRSTGFLFFEKVPFFILATASCVITFLAQQKGGAVEPLASLPLMMRVENAIVSYAWYIGKLFWPGNLAVLYPYREWSLWAILGAATLLVAMTVVVLRLFRQQHFLAFGWFLFLGTLVPVIGLVQVGAQFAANRYTYIPYIGLFVMLVWGLSLVRNQKVILAGAVAAIVACSIGTALELRHWANSGTLFRRALAVTTDNYTAHNNLGHYLMEKGQLKEAAEHFVRTLEIRPSNQDARNNLGTVYARLGAYDEAMRYFEEIIANNPRNAVAHCNAAKALAAQGQLEKALSHFNQAIALDPTFLNAYTEAGIVLFRLNRLEEAAQHFTRAVELNPRSAEAQNNLANVLSESGRPAQAIPYYERAILLRPDYQNACYNLAQALTRLGEFDRAREYLGQALRLQPDDASVHHALGTIYFTEKKYEAAIQHFQEAVRLQPDFADPLIHLAWLRSTHPDAKLRNGREALELARRAEKLVPENNLDLLAALAAAYAENGQFADAVLVAEKTLKVAQTAKLDIKPFEERLQAYRAGTPSRQN